MPTNEEVLSPSHLPKRQLLWGKASAQTKAWVAHALEKKVSQMEVLQRKERRGQHRHLLRSGNGQCDYSKHLYHFGRSTDQMLIQTPHGRIWLAGNPDVF